MKKVILISMMIASMATALKCTLRYAPYEIISKASMSCYTSGSGKVVAESQVVMDHNFKGGEGQSLFFVAVIDNEYDFSNMGATFDGKVKSLEKGE